MESLAAERSIFLIRITSLLFAASILIVTLCLDFARHRFVAPLNALAGAADHFAYGSTEQRQHN